jgi:hypothetical protein
MQMNIRFFDNYHLIKYYRRSLGYIFELSQFSSFF